MLDQSLALIDPLLQEAAPRSRRCSTNIFRLLSSLVSLCLAVLFSSVPCTFSGGGEQHTAVWESAIDMSLQHMQPLKARQLPQLEIAAQVKQRAGSVRTQAFSNFGQKAIKASAQKADIIPPSYNFPIGTSGITAGLVALKAPVALPVFFGALTTLLAVQATRVRFSFDNKALEVLVEKKDGDLADSGENFAVGGENRWNYNTFTRWNFVPSESFPVFMYFYETQTKGTEEQFHLFPVIMNSQGLANAMKANVGVDKMK